MNEAEAPKAFSSILQRLRFNAVGLAPFMTERKDEHFIAACMKACPD
jgi:hypothetical protein